MGLRAHGDPEMAPKSETIILAADPKIGVKRAEDCSTGTQSSTTCYFPEGV